MVLGVALVDVNFCSSSPLCLRVATHLARALAASKTRVASLGVMEMVMAGTGDSSLSIVVLSVISAIRTVPTDSYVSQVRQELQIYSKREMDWHNGCCMDQPKKI